MCDLCYVNKVADKAAVYHLILNPSCGLLVQHFLKRKRMGSYILSSSLQLGSKQRISSNFGNQGYLIGVIDTGFICGVMRLPLGDYCNGRLGMEDDKILGGGPYRWVSTGINSLDVGLV